MAKKVLIPIPDNDFDLTEVSVPWKHFLDNGIEVTFSTENGKVAKTDPLLITGVIFGKLGAKPEVIKIYSELEKNSNFLNPITYNEIRPEDYDALLLPGGHAKGMRQYLESQILQDKVRGFFTAKKIIAAICHGPVVLARTLDPATGLSVIYGKKLTALTKKLEMTAYYLTFWKLGRYYRTYPAYVEDEISNILEKKSDFQKGGSMNTPFVVEDGNLITARWPGDAVEFAIRVEKKLNGKPLANHLAFFLPLIHMFIRQVGNCPSSWGAAQKTYLQ
jgi:putative intracellular protease/amidase